MNDERASRSAGAPEGPQSARLAARRVDTEEAEPRGRRLLLLTLGALGVVYGDIGTSPLYAIKACVLAIPGVDPARPQVASGDVLGILSLITWALTLTISLKYLALVLRADNRGEGGILALLSLVLGEGRASGLGHRAALFAGLFGAALLYGDGAITPAISVLSAVEGLEIVTELFKPWVLPIAALILVGLFAVQSRGTARVGAVFGPITCLWFVVLFGLGAKEIVREPGVLWALDPRQAVGFLLAHGRVGVLVLGAVFLVVTGGEALYADMGHFGRRPIRIAWFALVLPALLVNYFGQGALLLRDPAALEHPFFLLAPGWAVLPLVLLATVATVIASQAIISGAFSLTNQAVHLGFLPRTEVRHTSSEEIGQIYVPLVNWLLLGLTLALVLGFKSSSALAGAYGVAVTMTMIVTTVLIYLVARERWGWRRLPALAAFGGFLVIDLAFFAGNIVKVAEGGWFPLGLGLVVCVLFTTWRRGRDLLWKRLEARSLPMAQFLADLRQSEVARRPGTGVFMTGDARGIPPVLAHLVRHTGSLPERVILLTVRTLEVPYVKRSEWVELERLEQGFVRVVVTVGFMESPTVARVFLQCRALGLDLETSFVTFYLGREVLLATARPGMALWRERLFVFMSRNAQRPTDYFEIPPERVLEVGIQVEL